MREFTVEALLNAIRNTDDLAELKRMVGPSQEMNNQAASRLRRIDAVWARCEKIYGQETDAWPWPEKEAFDRLMQEQGAFESQYC